ncbi:MAG: flagellar motor switch protein FliG [Candidatus Sericytochromatia bacterium]|nr:flagellar motor switch protein FliG [Candidatus Sericytochromatia bacterium]
MATKKKINVNDLTGREKAAILLVSLGQDVASELLRHVKDQEDLEQLTMEIANMGRVEADVSRAVLEEFFSVYQASRSAATGGVDFARDLLSKALGPERAAELLGRLTDQLATIPFEFMRRIEANQLLNFIQNEHPQTIALICAYLKPEQSALVLGGLSPEAQSDVAARIALMDRTSPAIIREVERILERKFSAVVSQDFFNAGGVKNLVEVLNKVDRATEKTIIESLEEQNPELADEVKKLMFVFEDIVLLDDRSIQRVLKDVESKDLALALKGSNDEVKSKIFKNMSERMAGMIQDELGYMGPVRLKDIEEVQQKIVAVIRKLEEAGEIMISRGGADDLVY